MCDTKASTECIKSMLNHLDRETDHWPKTGKAILREAHEELDALVADLATARSDLADAQLDLEGARLFVETLRKGLTTNEEE